MAGLALTVKRKLLFGGRLEVCSNGEIFRIKNGKRIPAAIHGVSRNGKYQRTTITIDGIQKPLYVHRLVAEAFIPNPDNKPCVNHKDGNPGNNDVSNLEWVTHSEDKRHAYAIGLIDPMANGKPCKGCGELTRAKGKLCPTCKIEAIRERSKRGSVMARMNELAGSDMEIMTEAERQVYELRCQGLKMRQIADKLGISYQRVQQLIRRMRNRQPENMGKIVDNERDRCNAYPILRAMLKQGKFRQFVIAESLGINNVSFTNKIRGRSSWKLEEMLAVKEFLGIDMPIEELFSR